MAIRFASAVDFRTPEKYRANLNAKKLSNAQNLSNSNMLKKEALLKNEAHETAKKIGSKSCVLKISADQIIENTVKLWVSHGK